MHIHCDFGILEIQRCNEKNVASVYIRGYTFVAFALSGVLKCKNKVLRPARHSVQQVKDIKQRKPYLYKRICRRNIKIS